MTTETAFTEEKMDSMASVAEAIYREKLMALLEPQLNGQVVAIHLDTGDFAVARSSPDALRALYLKKPDDGLTVTRTIGPERDDPTLYRMVANEAMTRGGRK